MTDTVSVVASLRTLAEKIQQSDPAGYYRLNLLRNAVEHGVDAHIWAYADIRTMIAPESIVACYRNKEIHYNSNRVVTGLETARNLLIFCAMLLILYGFSQDVNALRTTIVIGAMIIFTLFLLLTALAYFFSRGSAANKEREVQQFQAALAHAITGSMLSLRARPQLTAGDNLERAAKQLDTMMRDITTKFEATLQNTANQFTSLSQDTATRLDRMAQDTTTRFNTMAQEITGQFMTSTEQTKAQLEGIVHAITTQLQAGEDYLLKLGTLTSGVIQTSTTIESAATTLKTANVDLLNGIDQLLKPAESLTQQQEKLLEAAHTSVTLLQGTSGSIGDLVTRQQEMAAELVDVFDTLTVAVEKFDKLARDLGGMTKQQTTFLQQLQVEHSQQANLATLLAEATISTKNALSEMDSGATSLRSMTVDMRDLVHLLAKLSSHPITAATIDVSTALQSYSSAAQTIESSGNILNTSAIAIQRASQQLRDVLDGLQDTQNGHRA